MYLQPEDTVFTVTEKIQAAIEKNQNAQHNNDTDKFVKFIFGVPGWPGRSLALQAF